VTVKRHNTATNRAFALVVCTGCTAGHGISVLDELRATIRSCPNGVLVAAGCMLGPLTCAARPDRRGVLVLLQPCSTDRTPIGSATWVGPINDRFDAAAVADWVHNGDWRLGALPKHLRPAMNAMRQVGSRN
jgi:hypothetical protein